jgi:hypothetical protein
VALLGVNDDGDEEHNITTRGSQPIGREEDKLSHAGQLLRNLTEAMVRNMCGEQIFSAGLTYYMEGRISDRCFSNDTISAKLNVKKKGLFGRGPELFEPRLTFERTKAQRRTSIYGQCACSMSQERILCPHAAALMIAWVRKPKMFDEAKKEDDDDEAKTATSLFEQTRGQVMLSLKGLVSCIEGGSSRSDDLEVLQKTYSKLRFWTNQVRDASGATIENASSSRPPSDAFQPLIREFSATINSVSFAIMSAIESKYANVGTTDLYNSATVSTFAKVLESFVENASYRKAGDSATNQKQKEMLVTPAVAPTVSTQTGRSWDSLIEEFSSSRR